MAPRGSDAPKLSNAESRLIGLAGGVAIMKMRGIPAKDFFKWSARLVSTGDNSSIEYVHSRENAKALIKDVEWLLEFLTPENLMSMSRAIINLSRDPAQAETLAKLKKRWVGRPSLPPVSRPKPNGFKNVNGQMIPVYRETGTIRTSRNIAI